MLVEIGYKYRWDPTEEQETTLAKTFGCVRYVYNRFLELRSEYYKKFNKNIGYEEICKWLTLIKKLPEYTWLKEITAVPLQQSLRHCDTAFKRFFKGITEYPCFKKKNDDQKATYMSNAFKFNPENKSLYITGLGNIKNIKWHRTFVGKVDWTDTKVPIGSGSTTKFEINEKD